MPRKQAEPDLVTRDLARFFDRMAAHFPGHVMQRVLEPDGRVRYSYVSPGLTSLGLDPAAIVADRASSQSWIHPDDAARWRAALRASAESLDTLDEEVRVIGKDGRVRWVRSIGNPRRLKSGAVVWDGIALDATDKREALEALKLAKAEADAAEAAKSRALSGCAAALEAPLAELRAAARKRPDLAPLVARLEEAARLLVNRDAQARLPDSLSDPRLSALTERQRDVLGLLAEGLPNRDIGKRLGISEGTAKLHVAAILKTLGAANRTEAAMVLAKA